MHASVRDWIAARLPLIEGPRVIELGSYDVNGSVRPLVAVLKPTEYVGVDLRPGPGVDVVGDVCSGFLRDRYGQFDLVISTETLEHVQSWPLFVHEMKRMAKPGGHLLLTCRSPGFALHDYPGDYWRFTVDDLRTAFGDFDLLVVEPDHEAPGVFLNATKPMGWTDNGPQWATVSAAS
jgi:SAM-dependent methyltransferase